MGAGGKHECVPEVHRFLHLPHCMWRNLNQKKVPRDEIIAAQVGMCSALKVTLLWFFSQNQHKVQKHPANKNDSIFHTFSMLFAKSGQIGTLKLHLLEIFFANGCVTKTFQILTHSLDLFCRYGRNISVYSEKIPNWHKKMLISLWIKLVKYRWWCWQKLFAWKSSKHRKMSPLFDSGAVLTILANRNL